MGEPKVDIDDLLRLIEQDLCSINAHKEGFRSQRLDEAMQYALSSGGKRLRPLMVLAAALATRKTLPAGRALKYARFGACATELVHTYSLIHDDLPCMDDDDYRRGRLSVHRQFDEGLAVLAGDALLADAFVIASRAPMNAVGIVKELAMTAGSRGLAAGQAEDLAALSTTTREAWLAINNAKTARLFEACAVIGGLSVGASVGDVDKLRRFGRQFGVLFQLKDDLDDNQGSAHHNNGDPIRMLAHEVERVDESIKDLAYPYALRAIVHLTFVTATSDVVRSDVKMRSCSAT
jgi:geranylgeranyl pyrophosphate synthase